MPTIPTLKLLAAALLLTVHPAGARAAEITPTLRAKILLTALSFDKSLVKRAGERITVLTVGDCPTRAALLDAQGKSINGLPLHIEAGPEATKVNEIPEAVRRTAASVLFLCQAPGNTLQTVSETTKAFKMLLLAEDANWVGTHATLGVAEINGRPKLVLNIDNARESGADFDPRIFGVARIVP